MEPATDGDRAWRANVVRAAVVAGVLIAAGCSDGSVSGGTTSTTQSAPPTAPSAGDRVRQIAELIGCHDTASSGNIGGLTRSVDCLRDGRVKSRIHTFDAPNRGSVERRFS